MSKLLFLKKLTKLYPLILFYVFATSFLALNATTLGFTHVSVVAVVYFLQQIITKTAILYILYKLQELIKFKQDTLASLDKQESALRIVEKNSAKLDNIYFILKNPESQQEIIDETLFSSIMHRSNDNITPPKTKDK